MIKRNKQRERERERANKNSGKIHQVTIEIIEDLKTCCLAMASKVNSCRQRWHSKIQQEILGFATCYAVSNMLLMNIYDEVPPGNKRSNIMTSLINHEICMQYSAQFGESVYWTLLLCIWHNSLLNETAWRCSAFFSYYTSII